VCAAILNTAMADFLFDDDFLCQSRALDGELQDSASAIAELYHGKDGPVPRVLDMLLNVGLRCSRIGVTTALQLCARILGSPALIPRYIEHVRSVPPFPLFWPC
jgi:hypothetical protein